MSGVGVPLAAGVSRCACLDADGDAEVDQSDFAEFQSCFGGENQMPACP
ncbi:MAG TPA: hypothetical protein PLL20_09895 [Phycisphaerae bacterium]|nr:hypothetical protein [Phycisphaerae bacterium]HRR84923.1 hypothetical protein [Phycisphaerae bacterium]